MMTRNLPFPARRPSAALVPFRPLATAQAVGRNAAPRRRAPSRRRPVLDALEERTLLSGVSVPTHAIDYITPWMDPVVSLAPMQATQIAEFGVISGLSVLPMTVQLDLQAGEIVSLQGAYDRLNANGVLGLNLAISGPTGAVAVSTDQWNSWDFQAPATGTYDVSADTSLFAGNGQYSLTVQPIELVNHTVEPAASSADAALVSYSGGGLYAWLSNNPSGSSAAGSKESLTLSGPTGIGFQLGGNWTESTTYNSSVGYTSTYTDTGSLSLPIGSHSIVLPLPAGTAVTVTTLADGADGHFGQVTGETLDLASGRLNTLLNELNSLSVGADFSLPGLTGSSSQVSVGIGLGDSSGVQSTDLPVDPAVPYLYFSASSGASLSFGSINVSGPDSYHLGVAIDPTDPSFGIDIQGIPILDDVALEFSQNATIPYTPLAASSEWTGGVLYGDVYIKGDVDISAITGGRIPIDASAGITANLDPSHVGLSGAMSNEFQELLDGDLVGSALADYLEKISLGINGEVDLSLSAGDLGIELPVFTGSVIYDGSNETLYFNAGSENLFQNTPLANFLPYAGTSVDGMVDLENGQFQLTAEEDFEFGGLSASGSITVNNSEIELAFDTSADWSVGYGPVSASFDASMQNTLTIQFEADGEFDFSATTALSGSASAMGQTWRISSGSFWWSSSGNVSDMEGSLRQYVSNITSIVVDDIDNDIESWVEGAGRSILGGIGSIGNAIGSVF